MKKFCSKILAVTLILVSGLMLFTVVAAAENTRPKDVTDFRVISVSSNSLKLSWNSRVGVDGYEIFSCSKTAVKDKLVANIPDSKTTTLTLKNLKAETVYRYIIYSYVISGGKKIYSDKSPMLSVSTEPVSDTVNSMADMVSNGYSAYITNRYVPVNGNLLTTVDSECESFESDWEYGGHGLLISCSHGDYGDVSEISQFFDYKGYYNIAYENGSYLYIERYTTDLKKVSSLKLKKKYNLVGDVIADKSGNYYVVWGSNDTVGKGGVVTMAVSKYNYSGEFIKTTAYKTEGGNDSWETKYPFDAGNCDSVIDSNGILVCSYARGMYNGHQSNDVICVDTSTMGKVSIYSNYASHSFDQRVISLASGGVCFVNKGDGYPRGFDAEIDYGTDDFYDPDVGYNEIPQNYYSEYYELFHFYGSCGANYVNAWLGGVVEVSGNIFLVGSSAKSMTSSFESESQNLFIKLVDSERTISGSSTRKGKSCGESYTDNGIKWLTSYSTPYSVSNPQVVSTDDGRIIVMWEKMKNGSFVQSYYAILSADGTVIQKTTPMNKIRLNSHEDPVYKSGYVYWTTAGRIEETSMEIKPSYYYYGYTVVDGDTAVIHKLKVGSFSNLLETPVLKKTVNTSSGIEVSWEKVYGAEKYRVFRKQNGGEWKKLCDTTALSYVDKTAVEGKSYTYTVRCVSSNGKTYQSKYNTSGLTIKRLKKPTVTVKNASVGVNVSWNSISDADSYRVYRKTASDTSWTCLNSKVTSTSYTDKSAKSGTTYYYTVRAENKTGLSGYNSTGVSVKYLAMPTVTIANASTGIKVSWNKISGASGYYVYRKTGSGSWSLIYTVKSGSTVSYTDKSAKAGTTYYYTVRAYSGSVKSTYTSSSAIRRLTTPTLKSVSSATSGITFKWGKVTGASGYYVYRKTGSGSWQKIATIKSGSTVSYLDKTAKKGTTYTYTVKAYYSNTVSAYNTTGLKIKDKY